MTTALYPAPTTKPKKDPLAYRTGQEVLKAVGRYYYLSGRQLTRLLYAESSRTHALEWLKALTDAGYLRPANTYERATALGGSEWVWCRTESGRSALKRLGCPAGPPVHKHLRRSREFMDHIRDVNDTLMTLEHFGRRTSGIALADFRHDLDLQQTPVKVTLRSGQTVQVVPDGYVALEIEVTGQHVGLAVEVDRGTERRFPTGKSTVSWDDKVKKLVALAGGPHIAAFGYESLTIAVVIRSIRKSNPGRLHDLLTWTEAVLSERPAWGEIFRFTIADPLTMSPQAFVLNPHWVVPFSRQDVPLVELGQAQRS